MRTAMVWSAAIVAASSLSCSRPVLVPARAAVTEEDVTVEARTRAWTGTPRDLERRYTAVLVRVANDGRRPIAIARESFELLAAQHGFQRFLPDQIEGATADVRTRELKPAVLEPGEEASGFVYFEPVNDDWGMLAFRTTLRDPDSGARVDTIDVPFVRKHIDTCEAPPAEGEIFDTCLPQWGTPR